MSNHPRTPGINAFIHFSKGSEYVSIILCTFGRSLLSTECRCPPRHNYPYHRYPRYRSPFTHLDLNTSPVRRVVFESFCVPVRVHCTFVLVSSSAPEFSTQDVSSGAPRVVDVTSADVDTLVFPHLSFIF